MVEVGVETSLREMSPAVLVLHLCLVALAYVFAVLGGSSLAAVFDFVLMFLLVGQSLRLGLLQSLGIRLSSDSMRVNLLIDSLLSIIMTSCFTIAFAGLMLLRWMLPALVSVMLVLDAYGLKRYAKTSHEHHRISLRDVGFRLVRPNMRFILSFLFGVLMAFWLTRYLQWPEAAGADLFVHNGVTRLIAAQGVTLSLFGSYPYVFHSMAAAIVLSSGLDPFPLLAYGIFLVYPVGTVVIHVFFEGFMAGKWKPLLTVFATSFVAEGGALLGLRYTYPSTYVFVSTLLVLGVIRMAPHSRAFLMTITVAVLCLVLSYPAALLTSLPLAVYLWCNERSDKSRKWYGTDTLMILGIIVAAVSFAAYYGLLPLVGLVPSVYELPLGALNIEPSLSLDVAIFTMAYSLPQILLLGCGLASFAWSVRRGSIPHLRDSRDDRFTLLFVTFYLLVFFLPLSYGFRTELYVRPLFFICIVEGALLLVTAASPVGRALRTKLPYLKGMKPETSFRLAVTFLVVLSIVPTAFLMDSAMMYEPRRPNTDEMQAFAWLRQHVPADGYILTDPATGFLMTGFILRNCSTALIESNRLPSPLGDPVLFSLMFSFFNATAGEDYGPYEDILESRGNITFIVVSPRTSDWIAIARSGETGILASYNQTLSESDPSWSKFLAPQYVTVQVFGETRVMVRT